MIRRTILEWEKIEYGEDAQDPTTLPRHLADRIAAVAAASPLAGRGVGVLEHGAKALRAHRVVGMLAADGCSLEILPKIDIPGEPEDSRAGSIRRRLVHMLAIALDMKIDVGQIIALDWQHKTLLEILIRVFSEKLINAVRQGMPRRYVTHEDDLSTLRGRLDITRQFTALAADPSRLACRFDALSPDIALNQIMKAAIARLTRVARSADNQRRLQELNFVYAEISAVPVSALSWDKVVLDRTNARWRELLNLARLLLGERFQTTSAGEAEGFSLLFEMNTLFEEYVARMIRRALSHSDQRLHVVTQGGRLYCLETDSGGLFQTKPDILIKRDSQVVQVIDTKWKRLASRLSDKKQGVSQADVYQMMAYGRLYNCPRLTLLYPHHVGLAGEEGVQTSHRVSGCDHWLEAATIDVARAEGIGARLCSFVGMTSSSVLR
ncbi:McrBC 5-methylcytosine restriction system component-like protein [Caballeronia arvi]|uniref:McrBC 5-methylcytosine restriction system component-like protein n=1 Tax=Caballeronia arvi TaxID=1777135 RepID=A0A158KZ97_9BURK|nr:restriction endonuclease [Caballeronia arvi]SAL86476.1 McrBC 5-methylcytosine restriction system component-like protein [Caballeronia arvi]